MKLVLATAVFFSLMLLVASVTFLASNLAGPSGTTASYVPAASVLAIGTIIYVIGLNFLVGGRGPNVH